MIHSVVGVAGVFSGFGSFRRLGDLWALAECWTCCGLPAFRPLSGLQLGSKRSGLGPLETGQVGQVPCEGEGQADRGERLLQFLTEPAFDRARVGSSLINLCRCG